jgi:diaminopimelate epimerase
MNKNLKNCLGLKLKTSAKTHTLYCLAMPNPQAVIFVDNFNFDWQNEGREIERNSLFKNRINVMFTHVDSTKSITVMPWERGSGATSACGSGAAASTVVSCLLGYTKGQISVRMPGGNLKTKWDIENNTIMQEGPSKIAYSGLFYI